MKYGVMAYCLSWLVLVLGVPVWASQQVVITWPMLPDQQAADVRKDALDAGFLAGVVTQANALLAVPMSEERAGIFREYIRPRVKELIQGYSITETIVHQEPPALEMSLAVNVNAPAVKNILKHLGILYTSSSLVPTAITLAGVGGEDWMRLEELQTLTGVELVFSGADSTTERVDLEIIKSGITTWEATLNARGKHFSSQGKSLDEVWFALWQQYFMLDAVVEATFAKVRFKIDGWFVPEGVSYFNTQLSSWQKLVEESRLLRLALETGSLSGVWEVRTRSANALRVRLEEFLTIKGLRLVSFEHG